MDNIDSSSSAMSVLSDTFHSSSSSCRQGSNLSHTDFLTSTATLNMHTPDLPFFSLRFFYKATRKLTSAFKRNQNLKTSLPLLALIRYAALYAAHESTSFSFFKKNKNKNKKHLYLNTHRRKPIIYDLFYFVQPL